MKGRVRLGGRVQQPACIRAGEESQDASSTGVHPPHLCYAVPGGAVLTPGAKNTSICRPWVSSSGTDVVLKLLTQFADLLFIYHGEAVALIPRDSWGLISEVSIGNASLYDCLRKD